MRKVLAVLLLVVGVPLTLAGTAAAVYVGPDDTVGLVDEAVSTDVPVLVTDPSVLPLAGPVVHVTADAGDADVFVGVGHPVHVDSYLDGVEAELVTEVSLGGDVVSVAQDGEAAEGLRAPGELDWWQAQTAGPGPRSISSELTDEPVRVVVTLADGPAASLATVRITAGLEIGGLFIAALITAVVGAGATVLGVLLLRRRRTPATSPQDRDDLGDGPQDGAEDSATAGTGGSSATGPAPTTPNRDDGLAQPIPLRPGPGQTARRAAVIMVAPLTVAGCAQLPTEAEHGDHSDVVAVTPEAATAFFDDYSITNNAANAAQDAELLSTVESGTLLTSSLMEYEIQEAQDGDPVDEFTVTPAVVGAPRLDAYPMWFIARAEPIDGSTGSAYYLVSREDATAPWLAELAIFAEGEAPVVDPAVTGDAAATPAPGLVDQGNGALLEVVRYAETGEQPELLDVTAGGGLNGLHSSGLEVVEGPEDPVTISRSCSLEDDQVRWLATDDGAMGLAAVSCTQNVRLDDEFSITLDDDGYGTIPGETQLSDVEITHGVSFLMHVGADGSAAVIGEPMLPYAIDFDER